MGGCRSPLGSQESAKETPQAEAAHDAAATSAAVEETSPEIIAPETKQALQLLQQIVLLNPAQDAQKPASLIAFRSCQRAVHNAIRNLLASAGVTTHEELRTSIKASKTSSTVVELLWFTYQPINVLRKPSSEILCEVPVRLDASQA